MSDSARQFFPAYVEVAAQLGVRINPDDGVSETEIAAAEHRIGVTLPCALREYYAALGAERRLNHGHNRLIPVGDLEVVHDHFAFMEENQSVVFWACRAPDAERHDPPVYQCPNGDRFEANLEHQRCSEFLSVMLVWQAAMGALDFDLSSTATAETKAALENWTEVGSVQELSVYVRERVALAVLPWDTGRRAFLGSDDRLSLQTAARDLKLQAD